MVFESLLESILLKSAGKFVSGIDKSNLKIGIWSGKVLIENVSLQKNIVDMFDLPVNIVYSSIKKLSLKIPWKHLTSQPVDVLIDDIYLILTPKDKKYWTKRDFDKFDLKQALIEEYTNKLIEKFLKNQKSKEKKKKDAGYLERLTNKIVDNL